MVPGGLKRRSILKIVETQAIRCRSGNHFAYCCTEDHHPQAISPVSAVCRPFCV